MDNETKPSTAARRQFLADTARMACGVGLLGLGVGLYARHAKALPPAAIRPPGALPETDFSAACIRCGMCVRDCPFNILHLAKPEEPLSTGTPYFVARQLPCEMCEDIPCVKACPTGALDHSLKDINKSKMGLAVLVDHETCLNFLGLRRDIRILIDDVSWARYGDRQKTDPFGLFGGRPGARGSFVLNPDTPQQRPMKSKGLDRLNAGDVVSFTDRITART